MDKEFKKDDWAVVLDFLSHGHYNMERPQPVAYVLGEKWFSLLEIIVREDVHLKLNDRVYIGDDKRKEVKYIRGKVGVNDLTAAAKQELEDAIDRIITQEPQRFLDFYNKSGPVSTRLHQLELLPGIGKKHLWAILQARKEKPFESFDDIKERVPLLPKPRKLVVKRVMEELEDKDKYRIFVPRFEKHPNPRRR